ncbi:sensor histidine kinase [Psychromonas sp. Urea-02u-13]|uniref:sensor histidine kinase n=1 Tax=Psychromonas sp. Urea-02u-13 TaxID=2058326 RepID=UPI0012FEDDB2|nr:ATP-binding protein [Psychromonas sp. Urea-02u-13]
MLIQPLIENALIHGLAPQGNQGKITLHIKQQKQQLQIIVTDDGVGLDSRDKNKKSNKKGNENNNGVALKNIQARLQLTHKNASLSVLQKTQGGTDATITIPD